MTGEKKERRQAFPGAGLVFEKNLVRVDALRSHERTRPPRVAAVKNGISRSRSVLQPLVVDAASFVVLDGHHRLQALRELGCRLAPVRFVDYASESVRVKPRRNSLTRLERKTRVQSTPAFWPKMEVSLPYPGREVKELTGSNGSKRLSSVRE